MAQSEHENFQKGDLNSLGIDLMDTVECEAPAVIYTNLKGLCMIDHNINNITEQDVKPFVMET